MKIHSVQPSAFYSLFVKQDIQSIDIARDYATLNNRQGTLRVDLSSATLSSTSNWLVLTKITLTTLQGSFSLKGLPKSTIEFLEAAITEAQRRKTLLTSVIAQAEQTQAVLSEWETFIKRDAYLTDSEAQSWLAATKSLNIPTDNDADLLARLPKDQQSSLQRLRTLRDAPQKGVAQRNAEYTLRQLDAFQTFFDTVESNPLTDQQRQAIVHDEDNALVIAGAGTGKTSTVVGKVGYILKKGWAAPEEILLLAFTNKAAEEMRARIHKKLGVDVPVRTFHALGLEIMAQAHGRKASLCPEAEDHKAKAQTLKALIMDLIVDDDFRQNLLAFQSSLRRAYQPAWEFKSLAEYTQYLLDVETRALNGHLLKSYEECEIANWLVTHGVAFEYERAYETDTATVEFRQYKPDFYLPNYGIYIEHWGVDRNNHTAPFVPREPYLAKMQWAREEHAKNATRLVETYSWERQEGVLLVNLEAKLREYGVELRPINMEATLALLNEKGRVDPFVTLVGTFLSLFKSTGHNLTEMQMRTVKSGDAQRGATFLRLFGKLFARYEAHIHGRGEIDFEDMITAASSHVERGTYRSRFRYILIDEFQDIALGRAKLILALRNQVKGAKLFCVGDDWQSIYRFTGSDIALTTAFDRWFGFTRKTALDRTFRFHDKIAEFSSRFVQRNPGQLRKQISTQTQSLQPGIVIWLRNEQNDPLVEILTEIAAQEGTSLFLLSRYRHNLPPSLQALREMFPAMNIQAMTIHGSKGLEADYVVVNGLTRGKYGFPANLADDPVLSMALADGEPFEFAEERRLFYVALTRAKMRVYLTVQPDNASSFMQEILADSSYEKRVQGNVALASDLCTSCERGRIQKREGEYGVFYSCSNYPVCTYRGTLCSRCNQGRMRIMDGGESRCDRCDFTARICPRCQIGVLQVKHNGKSGKPFWGCSTFGREKMSCKYTEPVAPADNSRLQRDICE